MAINPLKRPHITLRVFPPDEHAELRRMAEERRTDVNTLLSLQLGPLRKQLRQRIRARKPPR